MAFSRVLILVVDPEIQTASPLLVNLASTYDWDGRWFSIFNCLAQAYWQHDNQEAKADHQLQSFENHANHFREANGKPDRKPVAIQIDSEYLPPSTQNGKLDDARVLKCNRDTMPIL